MDVSGSMARRLDARGAACRGLAVDAAGAMLGPYCPLVSKIGRNYVPLSEAETGRVLRQVFDFYGDPRPSRGNSPASPTRSTRAT